MKPKLLYILPEYDEKTATHQKHIFEMLEVLGKKLDIFLLIEKSVGQPNIKNLKEIYVPKNFLDRFLTIIRARSLSYKKAYIHYSYWGAILASLVMKTYYWHCEVYDKFFSDFKFNLESIKKKLLDEYLMVLTLKIVDYLVTGTPTVGKFYEKQFNLSKNKIKIIPNWINPARFWLSKNKKPQNKKVVLFLHRLVPRKGADLIPKIVMEVSKKVKNVYFVIAGDGPLLQNLKLEIKSLKLEKFTSFVGAVPNVETPKYFAAADVFILPSRQEGFPRVLLEVMAMNLPFVAMDVAGVKDITTPLQHKFVVPKGNLDIFINKLVELLKNQKMREKLSQEGEKQVKNYHLSTVSEKFYNLLK